MKHAATVGKSLVVIVSGVFLLWFLPDLLHVSASGGVIEKLIFTKPVVLAIRVSMIIVAFGVIGLVIAVFWKEIGIIKISSSGVEFGKLDAISDKTRAELAEKVEIIKALEAKVESQRKSIEELQELTKAVNPMQRGRKK